MAKVQGGAATPVWVMNDAVPVSSPDGDEKVTIIRSEQYTHVKSGELQGSATALQLPNISCYLVKFKAREDNAGNVYIGGVGVTKPDGTTDTTTGYMLDANEETGWIPVTNLNLFYRISDNAGDDLTYLALA